MGDSTFNFCINNSVNPNFDITWSFQYSVSGSNDATGGFSTFLFNNPTLAGGGKYTGLGYAPYLTDAGVTGSVLGIMFDSTNTIKVKNSSFNTIYTGNIFDNLKPFITQTDTFRTIRFNLTNTAQNLIISVKDSKNNYIEALNINTSIVLTNETDTYKVGFGYSSPLQVSNKKIKFSIKDLHLQGSGRPPKTLYIKPPSNVGIFVNTDYLIQSPLSGKLNIAINDTNAGSLLHQNT
jgi:hypothetical protein